MTEPNLTDMRMLVRAAYWYGRGIPAYLNAGEGAALKRLKTRGLVAPAPHGQEFVITKRGDALISEMISLLNEAGGDQGGDRATRILGHSWTMVHLIQSHAERDTL